MSSKTSEIGHKSIRNSNVEILRFFLMLSIFFWHVIVWGYGFKNIGFEGFCYNGDLRILTFLCALFSPAVYCFMFISGWYGIRFSQKKYLYFAFMGFSCLVVSIIVRLLSNEQVDKYLIINTIFPISTHKWWFLTNYMMVFLIAPFIECGFERLKINLIRKIIALMTIIETAYILTTVPSAGSSFFGLLYIYMLAVYLRKTGFNCSLIKLLITYGISLLLLWGMCFCFAKLPGESARVSFAVLGYNNPLIIIMAASLFLIVKKLKPTCYPLINTLFSNIIAIYLITEGIGVSLYKYGAFLFEQSFWIGIVFVFAVSIICLIMGIFFSYLFDVGCRYYTLWKAEKTI